MFDVVFISYMESNAEENWNHLKTLVPNPKRVHGIDGILSAHLEAARLSESDFVFIVDGDNYVLPEFRFVAPFEKLDEDSVYVWRAKNPVNDLVYGYGGVKLYSKKVLLSHGESFDSPNGDVATNIAKNYVVIDELASETRFNATEIEAWRGAFREAAKLELNRVKGVGDARTEERLKIWKSVGKDRLNGKWAIRGAHHGIEFAKLIQDGVEFAERLNDFSWLNLQFELDKPRFSGSPNQLETGIRCIQSLMLIYPDKIILNLVLKILFWKRTRDEFSSVDDEICELIKEIITEYRIDSAINLKKNSKIINYQLEFLSNYSDKDFFSKLRKFRCQSFDFQTNWSKKERDLSTQIEHDFPDEFKEALKLLFKEDFSERILFDIYNLFLKKNSCPAVKLVLDLRNEASSAKEKLEVFINFLCIKYENKSLYYFRNMLNDEKNLLIFSLSLINEEIGTWLTHGLKRTAQVNWPSDMINALSEGQVKSKLWLIDEWKKLINENESFAVLGGWHGMLAALIFDQLSERVRYGLSIDIDPRCEPIANQLNVKARMDGERFKALTLDMFDFTINDLPNEIRPEHSYGWVINTSCEHLGKVKEWFATLPKGTKLILQNNDFFSHAEHINCVNSLDEFLAQANLEKVFFSGELQLEKYKRFMIIGQK